MAEWGRSTLSLLAIYALFQIFLWAFVLPTSGPAPSPLAPVVYPHAPTRGSPAEACAQSSFTQEGTHARIALFDPAPLVTGTGPSARAVQNGEEVWRQLSLLRESVRDSWLHFAGDVALKQSWYDLVQLMQRQGPTADVPPKEQLKRHKSREAAKAETKVGSTRISFAYRPLVADLNTDWASTVWKGVVPPAVVVYSVGVWDAANSTEQALDHVDNLVASVRNTLASKIAAGRRVPTVVFMSAPSFAPMSTGGNLATKSRAMVAAEEELTARLRERIGDAQAQLAQVEAQGPNGGDVSAIAANSGVSSVAQVGGSASSASSKTHLLFIDAKPLAYSGGASFHDNGVPLLLNSPGTAASLAAFVSCHLGQPSWELGAFTPGQVSLAMLWLGCIVWWAGMHLQKLAGGGSKAGGNARGKYQRVGTGGGADGEGIEMGQSGAGGSSGTGVGPSASPAHHGGTPGASSSSVSLTAFGNMSSYFASPQWLNVLACLVQLGAVLMFMFLMDSNHRVSWWIVGDKLYVRDTFLFVLAVLFLLAWRSMGVVSEAAKSGAQDAPLLNREQTEEWKGVMQLLFVLYHYFAAKEMYNLIRVFIAAYVWMTGYGNFFFFAKTNDYSMARLVKMLFRLNFFVAMVCVALNREFMQYYVCALHTFYFLCVYAMMGICWQWNKSDKLLALKFLVLFGVLFLLFDVPSLGLFQKVFGGFSLFYWNESLHEWWFRSSLDHYATALGMLCAWNVKRLEDFLARIGGGAHDLIGGQASAWWRKYMVQLGVALVAIVIGLLWMVYCLWLPKTAYNAQHPYTSIIPIALYILLRNLTPYLRRHVLFLFTWFGKITLETYILQFHIWLSDDAATILTYFPNYPLFNWILSSAIYIALSLLMFQITNILSDALIPRICSGKELIFKACIIAGGWYTLYNVVHFAMIAVL